MKKFFSFLLALPACMMALPLFADAAEAPAERGGQNFMQTLIMIGIALVFFYFILWRPEQKRRKALEQQRSGMKKGDKVTAMGIVGTIVKVQETSVILKMVDGAKIEMLKAAITDVQPGTEEEVKKAELSSEPEVR